MSLIYGLKHVQRGCTAVFCPNLPPTHHVHVYIVSSVRNTHMTLTTCNSCNSRTWSWRNVLFEMGNCLFCHERCFWGRKVGPGGKKAGLYNRCCETKGTLNTDRWGLIHVLHYNARGQVRCSPGGSPWNKKQYVGYCYGWQSSCPGLRKTSPSWCWTKENIMQFSR